MSHSDRDLSLTLRYGDVESIREAIIRLMKQALAAEDDVEKRKIRRIFIGLPYENRSKVKIAALQALKEVGYWDSEIFDSIFILTKNDPDYEIRKLAEETILEVLKKTNDKKGSLLQVLKAIYNRETVISPLDAIKACGISVANELLEDENVPNNVKELIEFCLNELKKEERMS
ncbi:MAG: hypothetical protein ACTSX9_06595 [Candidatus Njordarchaeales archaeon]